MTAAMTAKSGCVSYTSARTGQEVETDRQTDAQERRRRNQAAVGDVSLPVNAANLLSVDSHVTD